MTMSTGISVEDVPAIADVKSQKGRLIAHKFNTGWVVSVVKSVEKKKSVVGQFAVKYNPEKLITQTRTGYFLLL
jgi:hypothetical protein